MEKILSVPKLKLLLLSIYFFSKGSIQQEVLVAYLCHHQKFLLCPDAFTAYTSIHVVNFKG